ncbi:unnamed protein product [Durusdinium trenchii]|uniref:Uncharacterized protein n=1 Tax=Durusdinium trenchii TaxID=1381693 RepID=A0ABP0ID25_9DINO
MPTTTGKNMSTFQAAFHAFRCADLPLRRPGAGLASASVGLELRRRVSQRVVTAIASLLLRQMGYSVLFMEQGKPFPAAVQLHASLEVWDPELPTGYEDAGFVGYEGDSGWWISKSLADQLLGADPKFIWLFHD